MANGISLKLEVLHSWIEWMKIESSKIVRKPLWDEVVRAKREKNQNKVIKEIEK